MVACQNNKRAEREREREIKREREREREIGRYVMMEAEVAAEIMTLRRSCFAWMHYSSAAWEEE
jgi:hypothetical protein